MSLPTLASVEDIGAVVSYLRTKPTGARIAEAEAVLKKAADRRKIAAIASWGVISKDGDRLKLTPRGWELARKTKAPEQVLREILDSVVPYRSALEWLHHQKMDSVASTDIAAHWHEHHSEALGSERADTIKDQAVCFFRLAEGAGLGKMLIGRRGAVTRLEVDRSALQDYIESGPSALPLSESVEAIAATSPDDHGETDGQAVDMATSEPAAQEKHRVFITHGKNMELVEQVETMLEVAEIESEVAVKEESTAIPVSEKVFGAMRRCTAGIIIVSAEQVHSEANSVQINPNVLIEIGAAFVLYDRRVVLLWEKGVPVPSNLQGLYRCEFEGKEISWTAGMKLLKAIKDFKR